MSFLNRLLNRNGINLMGASVQALAEPVVVGITGAGPADIYFGIGHEGAARNDQDKEDFHGWGIYTITLTGPVTLYQTTLISEILL